MRRELALIAFVAQCVGSVQCVADETARLPSIALLSMPTMLGSPSGLPLVPDFVPHVPSRRAESFRAFELSNIRQRIVTPKTGDHLKPKREDDDDDDDDDAAPVAKPGTLQTNFVKVPTSVPMLKNRSLGPHLKPDATFDLNDRTTVGIISQLDGLRASTVMSTLGRAQLLPSSLKSTSTPAHSMRSRDLGLGATLEFKLGQ